MALLKQTELFDTLKEKLQNITDLGWDSGKIKLVIVTGKLKCDHDMVFTTRMNSFWNRMNLGPRLGWVASDMDKRGLVEYLTQKPLTSNIHCAFQYNSTRLQTFLQVNNL